MQHTRLVLHSQFIISFLDTKLNSVVCISMIHVQESTIINLQEAHRQPPKLFIQIHLPTLSLPVPTKEKTNPIVNQHFSFVPKTVLLSILTLTGYVGIFTREAVPNQAHVNTINQFLDSHSIDRTNLRYVQHGLLNCIAGI